MDARYEHVRVDGRVVSQGVLLVAGVRELPAVEVGHTENEASYQALFRSLKERGLRGVELVTSDDHRGLRAAIGRQVPSGRGSGAMCTSPGTCWQLVGRSQRGALADDLGGIFATGKRTRAPAAAQEAADRWRAKHPAVASRLDEELEDALTCFAFPAEHLARIRTTNGLERLNRELKRRTRVVRIFPNPVSVLRLVTVLALKHSDEWVSGRRYLDMPVRAGPPEYRAQVPLAAAAD